MAVLKVIRIMVILRLMRYILLISYPSYKVVIELDKMAIKETAQGSFKRLYEIVNFLSFYATR
ncbi:hypothetical protein CUU64_18720 [Bacillus sp. V5-8f]|nr:hypothetical protein CUU64_18720 [Bacillus sp. V5-8f]